MYNPREVADNLKRSGAFVPGIRPGEQTADYIDNVLTRLTMFGAAYIAATELVVDLSGEKNTYSVTIQDIWPVGKSLGLCSAKCL